MSENHEQKFYGVIKEYDHWVVLFRKKQVTIGSVIIMSKYPNAHALGLLSNDAWAQFGVVCRDVEQALTTAFGAEKFNYLALMMDDPRVHFHVIPRYAQPVVFEGHKFIDTDWPKATQRIAIDIPEDMKRHIEQRLIQAMKP